MTTVVHSYFSDNQELKKTLEISREISLLQVVEDSLRKSLALAVGSYFEHEITTLIEEFAKKRSNECNELTSFIKNKALNRQYHSLFSWDAGNANQFFAFFGEDFKNQAIDDVKNSQQLKASIKIFLELGQLRNKVAHQNFASFSTDKTSDEIFQGFQEALYFLAYLHDKFK